MATIIVISQILDGNLGDGWKDNFETAKALADLTNETWRNDLAKFARDGHTVAIEIEVRRDTSGVCRNVEVYVDDSDFDRLLALKESVENHLTQEDTIWNSFLDTNAVSDL